MSVLILSEEGKLEAHALALRAAQPENWYRPEEPGYIPGDEDGHVLVLQSYRCVFSFTVHEDALYRHLSISVRASTTGVFPAPLAALTIASWFGFTGGQRDPAAPQLELIVRPGADWMQGLNREPVPHVVLAQRIGPVPAAAASRAS